MSEIPHTCILLIGGSLRAGSGNAAILRTAAQVAPPNVSTLYYNGLAALPHFNPDDDRDPLPLSVAQLRQTIAQSHAVLFSTPEYAGTLPGSFKNLLDWTIGGTDGSSLYERPVGWINPSPHDGGSQGAYNTLRTVLTMAGADIVEAALTNIPVHRTLITAHGLIEDSSIVDAARQTLLHLAEYSLKTRNKL